MCLSEVFFFFFFLQDSIPYPWEVHRGLWVACPWVEEAYQEVAVPLIETTLEEQVEAP